MVSLWLRSSASRLLLIVGLHFYFIKGQAVIQSQLPEHVQAFYNVVIKWLREEQRKELTGERVSTKIPAYDDTYTQGDPTSHPDPS